MIDPMNRKSIIKITVADNGFLLEIYNSLDELVEREIVASIHNLLLRLSVRLPHYGVEGGVNLVLIPLDL